MKRGARTGRQKKMPLAKKTSKNQITLPKKIADEIPEVEYFDVRYENGTIVLYPVEWDKADRVREKLEELGIKAGDIKDAVRWARGEES